MLSDIENGEELAAELRKLGLKQPPAGSWRRIRERAEALGLLQSGNTRFRYSRPMHYAAAALAAGMMIVLFFAASESPETQSEKFSATPETAAVDALMRQSSLLERALRLSPPAPRVVRAGLVSREAAAEDRIAAIDQRLLLNAGELRPPELVELWSERAAMMSTLIELRSRRSEQTRL